MSKGICALTLLITAVSSTGAVFDEANESIAVSCRCVTHWGESGCKGICKLQEDFQDTGCKETLWAEIEPQILSQPISENWETGRLPAVTGFASEWGSLFPHQLPSLWDLKAENAG